MRHFKQVKSFRTIFIPVGSRNRSRVFIGTNYPLNSFSADRIKTTFTAYQKWDRHNDNTALKHENVITFLGFVVFKTDNEILIIISILLHSPVISVGDLIYLFLGASYQETYKSS